MALKLSLDTVEGLDDSVKSLYVEKDGKFHLDVDGIEDTSGLKGALSKERKAREEMEKRVKRWEKLGKSEAEIEELLEQAAKAEEDKATKAGEWDKLRAQMNEKHEQVLGELKNQLSAKDKAIEKFLIDSQATAAIAAQKGVPDLLLPHVQRHVRVVDENGEFSVRVVDAKGDPRVNGQGEPLSIADLVSEMRQSEIFGRAFEGSGNSGSGTQPKDGSGGNPQIKRKADLYRNAKTPDAERKARVAYVEKYGAAAYSALPD